MFLGVSGGLATFFFFFFSEPFLKKWLAKCRKFLKPFCKKIYILKFLPMFWGPGKLLGDPHMAGTIWGSWYPSQESGTSPKVKKGSWWMTRPIFLSVVINQIIFFFSQIYWVCCCIYIGFQIESGTSSTNVEGSWCAFFKGIHKFCISNCMYFFMRNPLVNKFARCLLANFFIKNCLFKNKSIGVYLVAKYLLHHKILIYLPKTRGQIASEM